MTHTNIILYRQFLGVETLQDGYKDYRASATASNIVAIIPFSYSDTMQLIDKIIELHKKYIFHTWDAATYISYKRDRFKAPTTI